ncbi:MULTISPECIES: M13 family metallopeptidase [unclassified Nocardia]|uniref:M13 family metallopeptidase n=1 Tax=unclassified Nocardia TaxID=2637762 RepID=UPI0027E11374|nr:MULTISPECIES: M13 family metallopeptidase [unclassified Nocardia]
MTAAGRSIALDRRTFLLALGALPVVAACGKDAAPKQLTGPDLSGADPAIRPQDDLYRNVNGKWLAEYRLPPDKTRYSTFDQVAELVRGQLRAIVEGADPKAGTTDQQIRDLYDARMDADTVEKLGLTPLAGLFAKIDGAATKPDLAKVMGELPIAGLIGLGVDVDAKNSTAYLPVIGQSGIGIGEQYYRKPQFADKLAAYRTYLERLATAAALPDPAALVGRVLDLETKIAAAFWDNVRLRDEDAQYNVRSWPELVALAPEFEWAAWLSGKTDRPADLFAKVVVHQPSFVTAAGGLWAQTDIAVLRDYLRIVLLRDFAKYLPKAFADADFEFNGKVMSGLREQPERWKQAVDTVSQKLGQPLGKLYVAKHFPADARDRAKEMVADIMAAYRDNFTNSTWMSQPTRDAAIAKLGKIDTKIGYPDKWIDYSAVRITKGKLIESLCEIQAFERKRMFGRLGGPVDRTEWHMTPQTVNAYYNPNGNEIVFPAAFLQPPFFDKDAEPAVNYGAVGAVVGHEIGHGFDDQGAKYDGDGNRTDWWTPQDQAAFEAKTQQVIAQYDALVPEGLDPAMHVNGKLTVGENLADLRGLQLALAAYRIAEKRRGNDKPDYTPMFQAWARNWRTKQAKESVEMQIENDPHSPGEFRANQVVRNQAEFYTTFGVKEGDRMFLAADQRVSF